MCEGAGGAVRMINSSRGRGGLLLLLRYLKCVNTYQNKTIPSTTATNMVREMCQHVPRQQRCKGRRNIIVAVVTGVVTGVVAVAVVVRGSTLRVSVITARVLACP